MKKILLFTSLLISILNLSSCEKADNTLYTERYINKNIKLVFNVPEFDKTDIANFKIYAIKINNGNREHQKVYVNGKHNEEHDFAILNSELFADVSTVTITSPGEIWEYYIEYDVMHDGTPYIMTLTPYFNEVAQNSIEFNMYRKAADKGILEIKEYN